MPKVTFNIPQKQREIAEELREHFGGMMTATDVGRELGISHDASISKWLADVPSVTVNNRKRWRVSDVAAKIYKEMEI